ncbi:MAG: dUTP diphosphatase [Methanobacterium sp.]
MDKVEELRNKLFKAIDPNDSYSHDEFIKEYGGDTFDSGTIAYKLDVKFVNKSNNPDPSYATVGSAGFDLRANLTEPVVLKIGERRLIPTGLFFELPESLELQIRSRSGLSLKHGIAVLNGVGTIDSDYRGEIGVILINYGENEFTINNGDRIAQGVLNSIFNLNTINLNKVDVINNNTIRGTSGYGSSGVK